MHLKGSIFFFLGILDNGHRVNPQCPLSNVHSMGKRSSTSLKSFVSKHASKVCNTREQIIITRVHLKGLVFIYGIMTIGWTKLNKQGAFVAKQATDDTYEPKEHVICNRQSLQAKTKITSHNMISHNVCGKLTFTKVPHLSHELMHATCKNVVNCFIMRK